MRICSVSFNKICRIYKVFEYRSVNFLYVMKFNVFNNGEIKMEKLFIFVDFIKYLIINYKIFWLL